MVVHSLQHRRVRRALDHDRCRSDEVVVVGCSCADRGERGRSTAVVAQAGTRVTADRVRSDWGRLRRHRKRYWAVSLRVFVSGGLCHRVRFVVDQFRHNFASQPSVDVGAADTCRNARCGGRPCGVLDCGPAWRHNHVGSALAGLCMVRHAIRSCGAGFVRRCIHIAQRRAPIKSSIDCERRPAKTR